jgi:hypothetical protein
MVRAERERVRHTYEGVVMSYRPTALAALTCLLLAVPAAPARSQDRLPPIPPERQTEAQKKAAAEFRVERMQEVFGPFVRSAAARSS